jgi:type IX secretion system substrate protein
LENKVIASVIILAFQKQQLGRKKDQVIFGQEKELLQSELLHSKELLDTYTESMLRKSELPEQFNAEIEALKKPEIKSSEIGELPVFPNPNNGMFRLQLEEESQEVNIRIADVLGRTVHQRTVSTYRQNIELDISDEAEGLYSIFIDTQEKRYRCKALVLHAK